MAQNTLISSTPTPIPKTAEEDPVKKCFDKCGGYVEPCFSQCLYGRDLGSCKTTADCPTGYECIGGVCKKKSEVPVNTCESKTGKACVNSSECGYNGECAGAYVDPVNKRIVGGRCQCKKGEGHICSGDKDCAAGTHCVNGACVALTGNNCVRNTDCATGKKCVDGICVGGGGGGGDGGGGGGGVGEQFGWSPEIQALLSRILDRANSLLDQPLGLTDAERQAIYNRIFERIKGMERPAIQSMMNVASRQGLLGSPYAERGVTEIQRGTREQLANAERDIEIQEAQDRYQQLMGTTGMAQSLLGTGMGAEQLVEAANAARRGEGTSSMNAVLQYLIATGGQNSTYYQALLNWLTQHGG